MGKRKRLDLGQFFAVLGLFAIAVALFVAAVLGVKREEREVDFRAEYYFLVRSCESTTAAAVAGTVYGSGGAGVVLDGGEAVIVACYYSVQDAERVQSAMREKGVETRVWTRSSEKFMLKGDSAAFCARVEANAATAETCARLLYDAANGLERAQMSQAQAQAAARGAACSLAGLVQGNEEGFFGLWNAGLVAAERQCREVADGIVFAKDLRRIQAELLCAVVELDTFF